MSVEIIEEIINIERTIPPLQAITFASDSASPETSVQLDAMKIGEGMLKTDQYLEQYFGASPRQDPVRVQSSQASTTEKLNQGKIPLHKKNNPRNRPQKNLKNWYNATSVTHSSQKKISTIT